MKVESKIVEDRVIIRPSDENNNNAIVKNPLGVDGVRLQSHKTLRDYTKLDISQIRSSIVWLEYKPTILIQTIIGTDVSEYILI